MPIKIEYATALLKDTQPILRQMRTILGISHDLYLRMSTLVLNYALNNVVEEVRNMQEGGTFADVSDILSKRSKEKSLLKCAWSAMKLMDKFDMDASFRKNRYDENLIALRSICKYYEVSTPCSKLMKKSLSKSAKNNSSSFKNNLWAYFMVCVIRVLQFAGLGLLGGIVCAIFSDNKIHTFFEMWGSLTAIGAFFAVLAIIIALIKDAFSWIKGRLNW